MTIATAKRIAPRVWRHRRGRVLVQPIFAVLATVAGAQRPIDGLYTEPSSFATTEVRIHGRDVDGWMETSEEGPSRVTITYGQPHARDRRIFGGLVPFDRVWRFGANLATILRTDVDITIGGVLVPQGVYSLFALPSGDGWQLIVNKQVGQWGLYSYFESLDLARIPLRSRKLSEPVESFTIYLIPDLMPAEPKRGSGKLKVVWETTELTADWQVSSPRKRLQEIERKYRQERQAPKDVGSLIGGWRAELTHAETDRQWGYGWPPPRRGWLVLWPDGLWWYGGGLMHDHHGGARWRLVGDTLWLANDYSPYFHPIIEPRINAIRAKGLSIGTMDADIIKQRLPYPVPDSVYWSKAFRDTTTTCQQGRRGDGLKGDGVGCGTWVYKVTKKGEQLHLVRIDHLSRATISVPTEMMLTRDPLKGCDAYSNNC